MESERRRASAGLLFIGLGATIVRHDTDGFSPIGQCNGWGVGIAAGGRLFRASRGAKLTSRKAGGAYGLTVEKMGLNETMQVSFAAAFEDGRRTITIGRIKATTRWRAADDPGSEAERQAAIDALTREAEEYGADAIVDVRFEVDDVKGSDVDGVTLQRVTVTGMAVRFARAA